MQKKPRGLPEVENILEEDADAVDQSDTSEEQVNGFPFPVLGPVGQAMVGNETGNDHEEDVKHGRPFRKIGSTYDREKLSAQKNRWDIVNGSGKNVNP